MDPLKYLFEKPALNGGLSKWLILLAECDLKYVARKAIKGSIVSDFRAKNLMEGEDGIEDFLNEDILDIELGVDTTFCISYDSGPHFAMAQTIRSKASLKPNQILN